MSSTTVTPGPSSTLSPTGQPMPLREGEFQLSAPPNLVTFGLQRVGPPTPLYIQRDDVIALVMKTAFVNAVVTFQGRFLRASDGVIVPFQATLKSAGADVLSDSTLSLGEGYLLSLFASGNTGFDRGGTFVEAALIRGALSLSPLSGVFQVLFADYVTANIGTGWPGGRIISSAEGPGRHVAVTGSNPAAGHDFVFNSVSNNQVYWRPVYLEATLTTSATVASRNVNFTLGSAAFVSVAATTSVPASTTARFRLYVGATAYTAADGGYVLPMPNIGADIFSDIQLYGSVTTNIQAADQWSGIIARYIDLRLMA